MPNRKFLCLMPTYGKKKTTIENSIQLFLDQTHKEKFLIVFDDQGRVESEFRKNYAIISVRERCGSLPFKYRLMVEKFAAMFCRNWDAIAVWDDDDIYMPHHLELHNHRLQTKSLSYFKNILSTYTGELKLENSAGRFHGSIAFDRDSYEGINGWRQDKRADFDQDMISRLMEFSFNPEPTDPQKPSYIYRWGRVADKHCSALMRNQADESWYDNFEDVAERNWLGTLIPGLDDDTKKSLEEYSRDFGSVG